jgi:protein gp37
MSKIEWTGLTWNPIAGCTIVSPGCTNCYAMRQAARIERMLPSLDHYKGLTKTSKAGPVWTGKVALAPDKTLLEPLRRRKPTTYFVNSMSDLFHEDVPDAWIDKIFAVMALCPDHTFQVLTKRSTRVREYFVGKHRYRDVHPLEDRYIAIDEAMNEIAPEHWCKRELQDYYEEGLPLPHVWLGVSAERQQEADERIPDLLATPAAVRFVSLEPLLAPINLPRIGLNSGCHLDALIGATVARGSVVEDWPGLDWVIVGGESGRDARPMHPNWARAIRNQCTAAGVAFFFKQWGEYVSGSEVEGPGEHYSFPDGATVRRTGKKLAGRTLDGREWNEMPTPVAASSVP